MWLTQRRFGERGIQPKSPTQCFTSHLTRLRLSRVSISTPTAVSFSLEGQEKVDMSVTIAAIGECMLELSKSDDSLSDAFARPTKLAFGGDTLNTCIYLARLGLSPRYVTVLGDDPLSGWMADCWRHEGIDCSHVRSASGELPGLYFIDTDDDGERSFFYWRDRAPVKRLFDNPSDASDLFAALGNMSMLYLSGITLAVLTEASRERLLEWLPRYRQGGGQVAFDNNFRPKHWRSLEEAKETYKRMYALTDLALPTLEDEVALFGDMSADDLIGELRSLGIKEIALKQGEEGCRVAASGIDEHVPVIETEVIDTTSAGDSFNAGYLAGRARGMGQVDAAIIGSKLASLVIQHRGAIIPASLTNSVASLVARGGRSS
jgi:2-dehydro-3-deoxygluconokinase